MRVFGYNENKEVIQVELAIETVVATQLDPWRLDLFDPDPVALEVSPGNYLYFRRLRDIAFGYFERNKAIICVRDGEVTACLESSDFYREHGRTSRDTLSIRNARTSPNTFAAHLGRFLKLGGHHSLGDTLNSSCPCVFARSAGSVHLSGNSVDLRIDSSMLNHAETPKFCGEMFRIMPVPATLPEKINWVFEKHSDLQPLVPAHSVARLLVEEVPWYVQFCIENDRKQDLWEAIKWQTPSYHENLRAFGIKFFRGRETYLVKLASPSQILQNMTAPGELSGYAEYACEGVYAVGVNQVYATRIALDDIARRKIRAVSPAAIKRQDGDGPPADKYFPSKFSVESIQFHPIAKTMDAS